MICIIGLLVIKLQPNEPPGRIGDCTVYVEWLLRAMSMVFFTKGVHLWIATPEQKDDEVLSSLDASSAAF